MDPPDTDKEGKIPEDLAIAFRVSSRQRNDSAGLDVEGLLRGRHSVMQSGVHEHFA